MRESLWEFEEIKLLINDRKIDLKIIKEISEPRGEYQMAGFD